MTFGWPSPPWPLGLANTGHLQTLRCQEIHDVERDTEFTKGGWLYRIGHKRIARGGYRLPKVSLGHALPYRFTPCGWTNPLTILQPCQGWSTRRAGGLRSSSTPLDSPRHTPMGSETRNERERREGWSEVRAISRGIHGLPKVSLALAMSFNSAPCGWPPLKWPNICCRGILPPRLIPHFLHPWREDWPR
jgi:hypothetical protein